MIQGIIRLRNRYVTHVRETLQLSIPVIIAQLGFVMMSIIDNLMIGKLGYVPLSAASLANGVYIIIAVLGIGITFVISPMVAEALGAEDHYKVGQILKQGTWVGWIAGLVLGGMIWLSADILPYLDQPKEDVALADSYLRIIGVSVLPYMLFLVFKQFSDGLSLTIPAMVITLIALAFNVFANWLLIYGNWGFPRLELDGGGYATLGSRILMMALMVGYVLRQKSFKVYGLREGWGKIEGKTIGRILYLGVPSGLQYFFEVGAFVGVSIMIGWLENGSASRAAHQIAIQIAALTFMMVSGLATGSAIRVGNALGRKDQKDVRLAGQTGLYIGGLFMLLAAAVFIWGRHFIPSLFVEDTGVLEMAARLMVIGAFFQLFDGIQAVAIGILRGLQDVLVPTIITFMVYWGVALPLGYGLGFYWDLGLEGIWYSFIISLFLASLVLTSRFLWLSRRDSNLFKS